MLRHHQFPVIFKILFIQTADLIISRQTFSNSMHIYLIIIFWTHWERESARTLTQFYPLHSLLRSFSHLIPSQNIHKHHKIVYRIILKKKLKFPLTLFDIGISIEKFNKKIWIFCISLIPYKNSFLKCFKKIQNCRPIIFLNER